MSVTARNRNRSPYVDRACPSWGCSLQYGHSWTDGDAPGDHGRGHGLALGENVHLFAREWVDGPNDESLPSTTDSPTIPLGDGLERRGMTAEQARQHAAVVRQAADDLLRAADKVDMIEASTA